MSPVKKSKKQEKLSTIHLCEEYGLVVILLLHREIASLRRLRSQ